MPQSYYRHVFNSSVVAVALALAAPAAVHAEAATFNFKIPAGNLGAALRAFAQVSGQQVVYSGDAVSGMRSAALVGVYSADDGLRVLLSGSGMSFRRSPQGVFMISQGGQAPKIEGASLNETDEANTLAAIVVTAQYRPENTQSVPITVNSVSGKTLENSGYQSITDLQYLVPGLQYDPTQGANFLIRGVGLQSYDFSFEKSVSVVVDGVVMDAQRDNGLIGLEDIDRVDVLLGPQGTLFGKNATSGVISVTTGVPVLNSWSEKAYVSYGERNDHTVNTTINAPIGDQMALRISLFDQGQDGFGKYTTLDKSLGAVSEYGFRAKVLYQPNDRFDITLAGDWAHHFDSSVRTPVSGAPAAITADEIALGVNPGPNNASTADSQEGWLRYDEWGASILAHYKFGNNTLTSISAYRGTQFDNDAPVDLVPTNLFAYSTYSIGFLNSQKYSQEFRLAGPTGGFVEYVAGFFYNNLAATQYQYQWGPNPPGSPLVISTAAPSTTLYCFSCVQGVAGNTQRFDVSNITMAEYGQLKFNLTDRLSLNLGARYSYDYNIQTLGWVTFNPIPITGIDTNYNFVTANAPPHLFGGYKKAEVLTYRIAPEYHFSDNAMVYFTYATGNKPGGIALNGNVFAPYKPETVSSYEVGEKSEWFDHRVRFNLDLFHEQYTNYQAPLLTQIPAGTTGFINAVAIGNAGGLLSEGAEASLAFKPIKSLTLSGNGSYTNAFFTSYIDNATTNYTGTKPPNSPTWAGTFAADYVTAVASNISMAAHVDYDYRGKLWTIIGQPAYSLVNAYGLVNARISFRLDDTGLELGVYGRNLGNTFFATGFQQYGTAGLVHFTSPDAYRTVGVFAKYAFR
jgi:iron complex outermembrane receptor protein